MKSIILCVNIFIDVFIPFELYNSWHCLLSICISDDLIIGFNLNGEIKLSKHHNFVRNFEPILDCNFNIFLYL